MPLESSTQSPLFVYPNFLLRSQNIFSKPYKRLSTVFPRCYRHLRLSSFIIFPPNFSLSLSKLQINQIECREQLNSVILGQSVELLVKAPSLSVYLFTWSNFQFLPANLILKQLSKTTTKYILFFTLISPLELSTQYSLAYLQPKYVATYALLQCQTFSPKLDV